jgi:hypothetical protein
VKRADHKNEDKELPHASSAYDSQHPKLPIDFLSRKIERCVNSHGAAEYLLCHNECVLEVQTSRCQLK